MEHSIEDGAILPYNGNGVIADYYMGRVNWWLPKGIDTSVPMSGFQRAQWSDHVRVEREIRFHMLTHEGALILGIEA